MECSFKICFFHIWPWIRKVWHWCQGSPRCWDHKRIHCLNWGLEKDLKGINSPVVEAKILTKFKNLSFECDDGQIFTIYEGNCEFCHGRTDGWQLIGNFADEDDEDDEDEPFCPFAVTMVQQFQQSEGNKVLKPPFGSPEERQCDPMEDETME